MKVLAVTPQYYRNNVNSVSSARKVAPPSASKDVSFEAHLPHIHLKETCKKSLFSLDMRISSWFNFYAARKANDVLENRYGKGNYTVMVVGRSMASVGETMKLMGDDVRFLPLSGLTFGLDCNIEHIDVYNQYLRSIGLTKDIIANHPEHEFLLVDYTCSGNSLRNAKSFLTSPELLGNPRQIKIMTAEELSGGNKLMAKLLGKLYFANYFKAFLPVCSLYTDELDKVFERSKPDAHFKELRDSFLQRVIQRVEKYRKKTDK